ncbi:MAG TPA: lyase [Candidatus Avidesulfovibrio excrementigallinarum]|nr:lyase [Candidatus Avidesulfovibrio excrementigallinarum]
MRTEKDALGEMQLPDEAYYGIQALRSLANFDATDKTFNDYPAVVRALAEIKKACALANRDIGALEAHKAEAIVQACDDILAGRMQGQFPVNIWRGGGTSINMNLNEVIANRANEILTGHKGYDQVHPNTHVNMCQSSNDVYPTAENLVLYREIGRTLEGVARLEASLAEKTEAFKDVVRLGRTCLQDGVPMTLGQVFCGFHGVIRRGRMRLEALRDDFRTGVLGGTVVGTGIGVLPGYVEAVYPHLSAIVGFEVHLPANPAGSPIADAGLFDAMQNSDGLIELSAALKLLACSAGKIANDLRLLSSGPRSGFKEIRLPAVAPGSSIMPGKINPFMCDLVVQIMHQVAANDWAITMNSSISDLDLACNATVGFFGLLQSLEMIGNGFALFSEKCVQGIVANEEVCRRYAEESTSLATIVSTLYGYEIGSKIAKLAYKEGITCKEAALREKLIPAEAAEELFDVYALAHREQCVALLKKYGSMRTID